MPSHGDEIGLALRDALSSLVAGSPCSVRLERNAIIHSDSLLRIIVDNLADSVVVVTADGIVRFANRAAEALFARAGSELVGSAFSYPIEDTEIAIPRGDTDAIGEMRVTAIEWDGQPAHLAVIRDISERDRLRRMERILLQANERSAIAQLSATMAHEINNPTAFILANLTVMKDVVSDFEAVFAEARISRKLLDKYQVTQSLSDMRDMLEDNSLGLDRIRSFVRELKAVFRDTLDNVEMTDVNGVVALGCDLVRTVWGQTVRFVRELGDVPAIAADRLKLVQVMVNLLDDAARAAAERASGQGSGDPHTVEVATACDDESIIVSIQDRGRGIANDHLDKIFEPLFTAHAGRGCGLGLPIAAGIASNHGGRIEVDSKAGQGTVFRLILPRDTGLALSPRPASTGPERVRIRVLLVAGDAQTRDRVHEMLDGTHEVADADSITSALARIAADRHYDVVLCDLGSSAADAMALHKSLSIKAPALAARMVFIGDASPSARLKRFIDASRAMVLEQPLSDAILREVISRIGR